jgi:poly-D-alanine transfer protein DltD
MATNRDLLKEAIADAKAVKETAIANAKAALEEAFTPFLKEKLAAKINEIDEADEMMNTDKMYTEAEKEKENEMMGMEEDMLDEVSLDELLAELEEDKTEETYMEEEITEAEEMKAEEEVSIEDMSEEDLKSFIEDVIKDMVAAGELEAGEEGEEMEDEEEGAY